MDPKYAALKTIEDISILKGTAFETFLDAVFSELGYSVDLTPASGDYGADLILVQDDKKIVVQAKQYSKPIGFSAVKEIHFARTYYSASEAWVIATHGFTQQAINAAAASDVRLIDGPELLSFVAAANCRNVVADDCAPSSSLTTFDADLLKASRLVIKHNNIQPGYLEKKMDITFEKATKLLNQMASLGIISDAPNERKVIISDDDFIRLVDERYDPAISNPRFFSSIGHPFEVFRSDQPYTIIVVDNPSTYPSFFYFEHDCTEEIPLFSWKCVGIDQVIDLSNTSDIANRRQKVSDLKLYDVVNFTDEFERKYDPSTNAVKKACACEQYIEIRYAFDRARAGEAEIYEPGFVRRKLDEIEKKEAEKQAAAQRNKKELEDRRRKLEEKRKSRNKLLIILIAVVVLAIIIFGQI